LSLLTTKPVLYAANVTDHELSGDEGPHLRRLREAVTASAEHAEIVPFSAKIEAELADLAPQARSIPTSNAASSAPKPSPIRISSPMAAGRALGRKASPGPKARSTLSPMAT
jgi:ribosome-binding ATPase YchF (GTP1/OBG family)